MKYAKQMRVFLPYDRSNLLNHLGETPYPSAAQLQRKRKSSLTDILLGMYIPTNTYTHLHKYRDMHKKKHASMQLASAKCRPHRPFGKVSPLTSEVTLPGRKNA